MNVGNSREMNIAELQELRSVEAQLVEAPPKMAVMTSHPELKQAIQTHLDETPWQQSQLDEILRWHRVDPREQVDQAMQAMLKEAEKWAGLVPDEDLRDAGLIAPAQRVEHYPIACMVRSPPERSNSGSMRTCWRSSTSWRRRSVRMKV
jgi:ferritin-like metal-binding protein YciE